MFILNILMSDKKDQLKPKKTSKRNLKLFNLNMLMSNEDVLNGLHAFDTYLLKKHKYILQNAGQWDIISIFQKRNDLKMQDSSSSS